VIKKVDPYYFMVIVIPMNDPVSAAFIIFDTFIPVFGNVVLG
jgi:hypothetical protein